MILAPLVLTSILEQVNIHAMRVCGYVCVFVRVCVSVCLCVRGGGGGNGRGGSACLAQQEITVLIFC